MIESADHRARFTVPRLDLKARGYLKNGYRIDLVLKNLLANYRFFMNSLLNPDN